MKGVTLLLKDKFKLFRKELGLKQQQIAEALNCGAGKIKNIEVGATASISYADAKLLEKKYRISEQWLRFDIGDMFVEPTLEDFELLEDEFNNTISLPYFNDIKASAGTGCIAADSKKEYIKIPKVFLSNNSNYSSFEILTVHGDSMESTFYDNDLIIIDKDKKDLINGKIFIVYYEDELFVKRVFRMPQNKIILKSDNIYYPDIEVVSDNFKIIGQVVKALNFKNLS